MGNSAFFEGFCFRGDSVSSSNYIQKTDREFIRRVPLCRCLRRALLAILAVVSLFYQDFCPQTVPTYCTEYFVRMQVYVQYVCTSTIKVIISRQKVGNTGCMIDTESVHS